MTIRSLIRSIARRCLPSIRRLAFASPTLEELNNAASLVTFHPNEILQKLYSSRNIDLELGRIREEYTELSNELSRRVNSKVSIRREYGLEVNSSYLVYAIVRIMKPCTVLETGVANGQSSFFVLNAIMANGQGVLYSTDVSHDVGHLLDDKEKLNWKFRLIDLRRPKKSFKHLLKEIPQIDLFMHDSEHVYWWQKFEYEQVFNRMKSQSILASDDADYSYAFIDFTKRIGRKPMLLIDKRKVFGLVKLEPAADSIGN